jgi:hypothetical protein
MVCLRNISVDTLHEEDTNDGDDDGDDDDGDNNNNNNNNNNNDTCKKSREIINDSTRYRYLPCGPTLTQADVRSHNQASHILHQELATKCRIVKGKLTPCYEDESQFVLSGTRIINCTVTGP